MKMLMIFADANRFEAVKRDLQELGAPGYSAIPVIEGSGRTGLHTGDRVHPGNLIALFAVASSDQIDGMFDLLREKRDKAGDAVTRLFVLPVEKQS